MMSRTLSSWALAGALLASMAVNGLQWSRAESKVERAAPIAASLGLSDEQRERIAACCQGCCGERASLETEIDKVERELRVALAAPELDRARVTGLTERIAALRADHLRSSLETVFKVRDVLTPEQIEALARCVRQGGCESRE